MNTLLLRLMGPMQAWGVQSRFSIRDTGLEPSKSGVLGLICAALGAPREDEATLGRLAALRMGVRVDAEGKLSRDYHTASNVLKAGGGGVKATEPSTRYYLADAAFLVGLEGEDLDLLALVHATLDRPTWQLYLGRKAFVPGKPVHLPDGLKPGMGLEACLLAYPYLCEKEPPDKLRVVIEDAQGELVRPDQPLSFAERRFAPRRVRMGFIAISAPLEATRGGV